MRRDVTTRQRSTRRMLSRTGHEIAYTWCVSDLTISCVMMIGACIRFASKPLGINAVNEAPFTFAEDKQLIDLARHVATCMVLKEHSVTLMKAVQAGLRADCSAYARPA